MVTYLTVVTIYLVIGFVIGAMVVWTPDWRSSRLPKGRCTLFFLLVFMWFPLFIISFVVGPFIRGCFCDSHSH